MSKVSQLEPKSVFHFLKKSVRYPMAPEMWRESAIILWISLKKGILLIFRMS